MTDEAVLIAAISGRALAVSARRGGYLPLVADFFGDQDTLAAAQAYAPLGGGVLRGFREDELIEALEGLAARHAPIGVVCGTGFEDRPQLLARLAQRWRLLGNSADTVEMVKDPEVFAALCRDYDIAHPPVSLSPPLTRAGWLVKRRGGSGGIHVTAALDNERREGIYYQPHVPGTPVSVLLMANGISAIVIGFSDQWASPASHQPFRYGGATRPADLAPDVAERLSEAACRVAAALSLTGLNSADFIVNDDDFWMLEINPRPGATIDIFEPEEGSLFSLHVAACAGKLSEGAPRLGGAKASAISYAERNVITPARFEWPDWSADRPNPGIVIKAGEPLCTVHAEAVSAMEAKAIVNERLALVHTWTHEWAHANKP
jgi:uncharacterized protein